MNLYRDWVFIWSVQGVTLGLDAKDGEKTVSIGAQLVVALLS